MTNEKQRIYQQSLIIAIEKIFKEEKVSIVGIINDLIKSWSFKLSYDIEFYNILLQFLKDLTPTQSQGNEDNLMELIESVSQDNLITKRQQIDLTDQINILKRLRDVNKKSKKGNITALQDVYNEENSNEISIIQINQWYQNDKRTLVLQIEHIDVQPIYINKQIIQEGKPYSNLQELLMNIYEDQKPDIEQNEKLMKEVEFIKNIVKEMHLKDLLNLDYVTVLPYGSLVSGFGQKSSDLDISINTNCYIPALPFLNLLNNFIVSYCKEHRIQGVTTEVIEGKTPVLSYKKNAQTILELDISVNNILGCVNSRMLQTLSQIDPVIPKLGIVIKKWAKDNRISSKTNLSSYSFILMMFNFFFNERLLNTFFQRERQKEINNTDYIIKVKREKKTASEDFETNIYYINDAKLIIKDLEKSSNNGEVKRINNFSLSELFYKFIKYYSDIETNQEKRIITIFNTNNQKEFLKSKVYNPDFFFNIDDPFDVLHNPGEKTKKSTQIYYITAFTNALKQIEENQLDQLFKK